MGEPIYSPSTLPPRLVARIRIDQETGCWSWIGAIRRDGYGNVVWPPKAKKSGKQHQAHRLIYELLVGPIPEGLVLDHLCRNRACVHPAHLEPVTRAENSARCHRNSDGRCRTGRHLWVAANIETLSSGVRRCRVCARENGGRWRAAGKQRKARPGPGQESLLN